MGVGAATRPAKKWLTQKLVPAQRVEKTLVWGRAEKRSDNDGYLWEVVADGCKTQGAVRFDTRTTKEHRLSGGPSTQA